MSNVTNINYGLSINYGQEITGITNDSGFTLNSAYILPTQQAVKLYGDYLLNSKTGATIDSSWVRSNNIITQKYSGDTVYIDGVLLLNGNTIPNTSVTLNCYSLTNTTLYGKYFNAELIYYNNYFYSITNTNDALGYGSIVKTDINLSALTYINTCSGSCFGGFTLYNNKFYSATSTGGLYNCGYLYEYNPSSSTITVLHNFINVDHGSALKQTMTLVGDKLYGTCTSGGTTGRGTLFEYNLLTSGFTKLFEFDYLNNGSYTPLEYYNNKLYSTLEYGTGWGAIFSYDLITSAVTILYNFDNTYGSRPTGKIVIDNGLIYGTCYLGGDNNGGVIYKYNISGNTYTVLHHFYSTGGTNCYGGLILYNNKLYGGCNSTGAYTYGTVFEYSLKTNIFKKIKDSAITDIANIKTPLLQYNGHLYGTSYAGGTSRFGSIYKLNIKDLKIGDFNNYFYNIYLDNLTLSDITIVKISNSTGLTENNSTYLATQYAIKSYVDYKFSNVLNSSNLNDLKDVNTGGTLHGYYLMYSSGTWVGNSIINFTDITYSNLLSLVNSSGLTKGNYYKITDYQTKYKIPNTSEINIGATEELIVYATSNYMLDKQAYSVSHPEDIIYYDIFDNSCEDGTWNKAQQKYLSGTSRTGKIYYRNDTKYNLVCYYDWRNVKFRRWKVDAIAWQSGITYTNFYVAKSSNGNIYKCLYTHSGTTDPSSSSTTNWTLWLDLTTYTSYWSWTSSKTDFTPGYINTTNLTGFTEYQDFYTFTIYDELTNSSGVIKGTGTGVTGVGFRDYYIGVLNKDHIDDYYSININGVYNNNVFFLVPNKSWEYYSVSNSLKNDCFNNTIIANSFFDNDIQSLFSYNVINHEFNANIVNNFFSNNSIGKTTTRNVFQGNVYYNTLSKSFNNNMVGVAFWYNDINDGFIYNNIDNNFSFNNIGTNFSFNNIGAWFSGGANNLRRQIGNNFKSNTIESFSIYSRWFIADNFRYNDIKSNSIPTNTNLLTATHVYGDYDCTIFRTNSGMTKIRYVDNDSNDIIANITD
jgi:uncharacterized repeat protein (TIGR03803 family)